MSVGWMLTAVSRAEPAIRVIAGAGMVMVCLAAEPVADGGLLAVGIGQRGGGARGRVGGRVLSSDP